MISVYAEAVQRALGDDYIVTEFTGEDRNVRQLRVERHGRIKYTAQHSILAPDDPKLVASVVEAIRGNFKDM